MSSIDYNSIIFDLVKWAVGGIILWFIKTHDDARDMRKDLNAAFEKIRELEKKTNSMPLD